MTDQRRIAFILFDGVKMLDVAGPAEVFAEANLVGADYVLSYVAPSGTTVLTSSGMHTPVDAIDAAAPDYDTVVVCGGDILVSEPIDRVLIDAVRQLQPRTRRLVSICTGSFVLAEAGVLTGRKAATHWRHAQALARRHPDIEVLPDALFVCDGDIYTSAGVSAGIDLALALVEQDYGSDLARTVARNLVLFMQRPGGQSQYSTYLDMRPPRIPELREVVDLISSNPALDHSTSRLAARVGVSSRHLARLFSTELNTTPAKYVERVRLDHAKALLEAGHAVENAARAAGFGSAETMRRSFVARIGVPPSQYRDRFMTTNRG
ncbi:GlxA family transcriptional regulator [Mycobacterium sp. CBMA293]|uniref:GlxA family transcriptional regulator n=1 Tax=unclassified Mycolicibacterium TaxID=2636767 RepID=UPI0012DF2F24|nr:MULTISPECIES: GlxA family transcriptional regulator [unclassified Mycolicibacterium]MUL46740.1 GlxA family transcriptional regulator [Mycolicibacterium sp. CBMA 360]MUL57476.1 GlxA family transcriptional regulator [Mycolicibacterium sp. CBMA 335]MUL70516.1 GlxA family transcriptional regulator [Mycolicibacterium sp. CBMA 311]MUL92564.1 GlxA family transcriptional regulator [Mycolicibacterium sp. CBMA 230]MUM04940.1 AraC family transcriptional regulator [Mycolicibacterium sp. CBMA 213]